MCGSRQVAVEGAREEHLRRLGCEPLCVRQPHHIHLQRENFVDKLLVRHHLIVVMIRWTGLAPWKFQYPFPGSLTSTFLELHTHSPINDPRQGASQRTTSPRCLASTSDRSCEPLFVGQTHHTHLHTLRDWKICALYSTNNHSSQRKQSPYEASSSQPSLHQFPRTLPRGRCHVPTPRAD